MTVLDKIASVSGGQDDVPNQELARELAAAQDREGIRLIAENLWNRNAAIQSDCLKVLYEIGYIDPMLMASYVGDFLKLLQSRNNRLVWGSMIALATVAKIKAEEIYLQRETVQRAIEAGSVITVDNGIKALAGAASTSPVYRREIFPYLLAHLQTCRPKDVAQHSEHILAAVDADNRDDFVGVLEKRMGDVSDAGMTRIKRTIRKVEKMP